MVRREAFRDRQSVPLHDAGSEQRQSGRDVSHPSDLLHVPAVGSHRRRGRQHRTASGDRQRRAGHGWRGQQPPTADIAAQLRDVHAGAGTRSRTADRVAAVRCRPGVSTYPRRREDGNDEGNVLESHRFSS